MGLGQKTLTWVGSGRVKFLLFGSNRDSHFWFEFDLENFQVKSQIFQFFALWVKKNLIWLGQKVPGSAAYLLWVKGMLGLGQGPSLEVRLKPPRSL